MLHLAHLSLVAEGLNSGGVGQVTRVGVVGAPQLAAQALVLALGLACREVRVGLGAWH